MEIDKDYINEFMNDVKEYLPVDYYSRLKNITDMFIFYKEKNNSLEKEIALLNHNINTLNKILDINNRIYNSIGERF